MSEINYDKMDKKIIGAVKAIEAKPHVRYIRYLMTKRYSPISIKQELFRLGLSAPHEPNLVVYYMAVIDPIVKKYGLSQLYADYKNKLLRKNKRGDFAKDILNYRLNLGDDLDGQVKFCKFIKSIEVDEIWMTEIYKFHGTADRLPIDEDGKRILEAISPRKTLDKILIHPKRYLIDKMLLENVPDSRISKYCRETIKLIVNDYDIAGYRRIFFNVKTLSVEERIKSLEVERNSLDQLLSDLDNLDDCDDMDMGEKTLIRKQTEQRMIELDDNIKTLNMMYSEFAFNQASHDQEDFESMFTDVTCSLYNRFKNLDQFKDRDVVDPLFKVTRMMVFSHDKLEQIRATTGPGKTLSGDKHSQGVIVELYKKRMEDIAKEQLQRANETLTDAGIEPINEEVNYDDIMGVEELGVNLDLAGSDDKDKK